MYGKLNLKDLTLDKSRETLILSRVTTVTFYEYLAICRKDDQF